MALMCQLLFRKLIIYKGYTMCDTKNCFYFSKTHFQIIFQNISFSVIPNYFDFNHDTEWLTPVQMCIFFFFMKSNEICVFSYFVRSLLKSSFLSQMFLNRAANKSFSVGRQLQSLKPLSHAEGILKITQMSKVSLKEGWGYSMAKNITKKAFRNRELICFEYL